MDDVFLLGDLNIDGDLSNSENVCDPDVHWNNLGEWSHGSNDRLISCGATMKGACDRLLVAIAAMCIGMGCSDDEPTPEVLELSVELEQGVPVFNWPEVEMHELEVLGCDLACEEPCANGDTGPSATDDIAWSIGFSFADTLFGPPVTYGVVPNGITEGGPAAVLAPEAHYVVGIARNGPCGPDDPPNCRRSEVLGCASFHMP